MNKHEQIAKQNIIHCINWEVGGWYNCIQDGCPECIPDTREEALAEIYQCSVTNLYRKGYCGSNKAPKEMRFAGAKFIMETIDKLLENDGDWLEIAEEKGWE